MCPVKVFFLMNLNLFSTLKMMILLSMDWQANHLPAMPRFHSIKCKDNPYHKIPVYQICTTSSFPIKSISLKYWKFGIIVWFVSKCLLNYFTPTFLNHNVNNTHIARKCRFKKKRRSRMHVLFGKSINEKISFSST